MSQTPLTSPVDAPDVPIARSAKARPRRVNSEQLFGEHDEVEIFHLGQVYRLRRTRSAKLILNK